MKLLRLTDSLHYHTWGDYAPPPPGIPFQADLWVLANTYVKFVCKVLGEAIRQLIAQELRLFPDIAQDPPILQLNRLQQRRKKLRTNEPAALQVVCLEITRVISMMDKAKEKCPEYRRAWDWFHTLENYAETASAAGLLWREPHEVEDWFWRKFERMTRIGRFNGLIMVSVDYSTEEEGSDGDDEEANVEGGADGEGSEGLERRASGGVGQGMQKDVGPDTEKQLILEGTTEGYECDLMTVAAERPEGSRLWPSLCLIFCLCWIAPFV